MASISLNITALSQTELVDAVHALSRRFKGPEEAGAASVAAPAVAKKGRQAKAAAPAEDEAVQGLHAADDQGDAGAAPDAAGAADTGDAGAGDLGRSGEQPGAGADAPPAEEAGPAAEATPVTIDDVKAAARDLAKSKGIEAVQKVLGEFDARTAKDLPEADYAAAATKMREAA